MKISTVFAFMFAAACVVAVGCDSLPFGGQEPPPPPMPAPPPLAPPGMPAAPPAPTMPVAPGVPAPGMPAPGVPVAPGLPGAPVAPGMPGAPPPVAAPAGAPNPFVWTETPAFNQIPDQPASGMANGMPFTAQAVVFEPATDSWRMMIRDEPITEPTGVLTGGQSINIDLPAAPAPGANWLRPMEYGDGYFQVRTDPANPTATTSWNADNAWAIEITSWTAADYDESGSLFQDAGRASGRFAVCYKGSATLQNSWVSGTFENAIVRYMGKPYWLKEGGKAPASGGSTAKKGTGGYKLPSLPTPPPVEEPKKEEPKKEEPKKEEPKDDQAKAKDAIKKGLGKLNEEYKKKKKKKKKKKDQ